MGTGGETSRGSWYPGTCELRAAPQFLPFRTALLSAGWSTAVGGGV